MFLRECRSRTLFTRCALAPPTGNSCQVLCFPGLLPAFWGSTQSPFVLLSFLLFPSPLCPVPFRTLLILSSLPFLPFFFPHFRSRLCTIRSCAQFSVYFGAPEADCACHPGASQSARLPTSGSMASTKLLFADLLVRWSLLHPLMPCCPFAWPVAHLRLPSLLLFLLCLSPFRLCPLCGALPHSISPSEENILCQARYVTRDISVERHESCCISLLTLTLM